MATSCTRKEWATAVAADSEVCIGRLGRDEASVREEEAPSLFDLLNHRNILKRRYAPARGASLHERNELYSKLSKPPP